MRIPGVKQEVKRYEIRHDAPVPKIVGDALNSLSAARKGDTFAWLVHANQVDRMDWDEFACYLEWRMITEKEK